MPIPYFGARKPDALRAISRCYWWSRVGISLPARLGGPELSLSWLPATGALE